MAGDWIKVRTSLVNDGRVKVSAKKMNLKGNAGSVSVLGGLVTLWSLADEHADDEGVLYGYDETDINELVGIEGFAENLHRDWIDTSGEWVKLPEYHEHNGQTAKKRAQTAKRVANHKANATTNAEVTQAPLPDALPREEKRREDIKESKKKKFIPPSVDQVINFFDDNGYTKEHATKVFNYYQDGDWKDASGKPVKAWKQKMRGNWFKDDGKKTENSNSPFHLAVTKAKELQLEPFKGAPDETPQQFIERVNNA